MQARSVAVTGKTQAFKLVTLGRTRVPACSIVVPRRGRSCTTTIAAAAAVSPGNSNGASRSARDTNTASNGTSTPTIFTNIEGLIQTTFNSTQPGSRLDWEEVEGNWVLYPPLGREPEAVVHFLGGAFVGAAPQLSYRLFLEALASRNVVVIATPYPTSFDQLRVADEVKYKFDRCLTALGKEVSRLSVYGVGHSQGSLVHMLICARFPGGRAGNALLGFNNRPATDTIPFLSPFIAPSARVLGPVVAQMRSGTEAATDVLKGLSPSLVRQMLPLVEQLTPIFLDVAQGRQEFSPSPEEAKSMIKSYYGVPRNLLLRFKDDSIDETLPLASLLQTSNTLSGSLDITMRTLSGGHVRPMQQAILDLPPPVARIASQAVSTGGTLIGQLANAASEAGVSQATGALDQLNKGVNNLAHVFGGQVGGPVTDNVQELADEVAAWMGVGNVVVKGTRALPASAAIPTKGRRASDI